jgi:hypothetical protein
MENIHYPRLDRRKQAKVSMKVMRPFVEINRERQKINKNNFKGCPKLASLILTILYHLKKYLFIIL